MKIKLEGPWCLPNDPNAARIGICKTISENYYFTLKIKNEDNRVETNLSYRESVYKRTIQHVKLQLWVSKEKIMQAVQKN